MVIKIRIHGRGGQGVVMAAQMISAAAFHEGLFSRSFATYGIARRGSPVTSFAMVGERNEMTRSKIYEPDCVIVLDPRLPRVLNVLEGIRQNGTLIQNTAKSPGEALEAPKSGVKRLRVGVVDATSIALRVLGSPVTNTATLGAFARVTEMVSLDSMLKAVERSFKGELVEKNLAATRLGYDEVRVETFG